MSKRATVAESLTGMANLRLNRDDKDEILSKAMIHGFKARKEALDAEEDALAVRCHSLIYSKKVRDFIDTVPAGWVKEIHPKNGKHRDAYENSLIVQIGHEVVYLNLHTSTLRVKQGRGTVLGVIEDQKIIDRYRALVAEREKLEEERGRAHNSLSALLERVRTLRQLAEAWPEGKDFYSHLKPRASGVPMITISALNAALGLSAEGGGGSKNGAVEALAA